MARKQNNVKPASGKKQKRTRSAKLPPNIIGKRYTRLIEEQLERFHKQPAHGNRSVLLDHIVIAHLLAFFNPAIKGLRSIEDIFEHPRVRRQHKSPRLPKSTLSDAQKVFDPALLLPLIDSMVERAKIQPHDERLDSLTQKLLAVDGTLFAVAPRIAWALYNQSKSRNVHTGQVRIHVDFDVLKGIPQCCTVTDGQEREEKVLSEHLESGCLYVMDRGFQAYYLLEDIIKAQSDFVVRQRHTMVAETQLVKPLCDEDVAAGVISDLHVVMGERPKRNKLPVLRMVDVEYIQRNGELKQMRLLTSLMDVPAWMVALIYKHRWQVELFFRWLKCSANFEHFFSEDQTGMTTQVYVTMIALLLIAIETGARPSKYDYTIMSAIYSGMLPLEGSFEIMERRRKERQRAAERQREKKKN